MSDVRQEIATAPAAGWYPDPANVTSSRWWDGAAWTDHVQPAAVAAVPTLAPDVAPIAPAMQPAVTQAAVPQPGTSSNLDADGVPLSLFADSVFSPSALAPTSGPATQSDWHSKGNGRNAGARRQPSGSVSLSTAAQSSRRTDPYDRNWMTGLAIVVAVLSIPALALRVAWDLPPLTQSIFAGAPIAISLLALVSSIRRGGRFVLAIVAVLISAAVLVAGFVLDPAILRSAVDAVIGLLPA